jgi:predicted extracellular nuclease
MPTLFVTEYSGAARGGQLQVAHGRRLRKNNVAIGAGSTPSAAFGDGCSLVRIATDTNCSFVFSQDDGVSPTATNTDQYLPAGSVEYFTTKPGDFIAVIQNP